MVEWESALVKNVRRQIRDFLEETANDKHAREARVNKLGSTKHVGSVHGPQQGNGWFALFYVS